ncbi:MAG: outer membrane lipoprotein-sorting protein [Verrucomicrobiota bacterium]|nr:outer membrane lipoprotein-sorting protein [Verrucomicrobiota bacterium]
MASSLAQNKDATALKQRISLIALLMIGSSVSAQSEFPPAQVVLTQARLQQSQQQIDLKGQLRQDAKVVPFRLIQNGNTIRYVFANPSETLLLKLGDNGSSLSEITRSGSNDIKGSELSEKIRGTGISYEDLALDFLYWPNAKVIASDSIQTRECWRVQVSAPRGKSQYGTVWLWIEKKSGTLMQLQGFNMAGQLVKRFEIVSVQKIAGRWFLKQMRVEALDPPTGRVLSRTYLEISS